ncbi:MAG TPA: hypothetical protein VHN99_06835 [Deinococcales bacterium]|nr:hypothetical protein [Deinococcales bacterium]
MKRNTLNLALAGAASFQAYTTGTYTLNDLLAVTERVVNFGEDSLAQVIQADLAAHNLVTLGMLAELATPTTLSAEAAGAQVDGDMVELDEFGLSPTQKTTLPAGVAYPLGKFGHAVGWTKDYMLRAKVADIVAATGRATRGHRVALQRAITKALFTPTNYSVRDKFRDGAVLNVKRLYNADGDPISSGPNGEFFDGTVHTHYQANATLTTTALDTLIGSVLEHGYGNDLRVYINRAQDATVRALTGFAPVLDARIIAPTTGTYAQGDLNVAAADNRQIGVYGGAAIWTKPWVPAGYVFCYAAGDPIKPLKFRQDDAPELQGLRMVAQESVHPLVVDNFEAYYGFGAFGRGNGAVLYVGGASYVVPTIP